MTPEEQQEFLRLKDYEKESKISLDNLNEELKKIKTENEDLKKINQKYFLRLTADAENVEPEPQKKEEPPAFTGENLIKILLKKEK